MGCFATCFGTKKHQPRSRKRPIKTTPCLLDHLQNYESVDDFRVSQLIEGDKTENPIDPLPESRSEEKSEKANLSERKKVTFDLNVKIYEGLPTDEQDDNSGGNNEQEQTERKTKKEKACEIQSPSDSSSSSLFSYPHNHRYQNCRDSDDEFDELMSSDESDIDDYTDDEGCDCEGEEVDSESKRQKPVTAAQDQSSESLFSLSLDSRKHNLGAEAGDKEVNSPMAIKNQTSPDEMNQNPRYDRSKYVDSVLNPVENVTQWKVIKARSRRATKDQTKENLETVQGFEAPVKKDEKEMTRVDTSLSSWLVGSEAVTPNSRSSSVSVGNSASDRSTTISPNKFEDRPILGALTLEEIRQFSATSSPRKSPSKSPDDMPIIGTVGSYWSHTGQTTESGSSTRSRSRFTESTKVMWDSTPFETRLEKALENEGSAEQVVKV